MPQLAKTSKDQSHTHLVYLSDIDFTGATSVKKGHVHGITFDEEAQTWTVEPAEDGHTHELLPYQPSQTKEEKLTDEEKANQVLDLYRNELQVEHEARKCAKESQGFYTGREQWSDKAKSVLQAQGRASITINEVAAKVDLLCGFQRQNRTDTKFAPVEEGDQSVAKLLDVVYKNIEDQNGFEHEEAKAFQEQIIEGRGIFHVYVDYDQDIQGKVVIESIPNRCIAFGPHERHDLSDCEHLSKFKMFSKGKVEQMFPEQAKDLNIMFTNAEEAIDSQDPIIDNPGDQYSVGVEIEVGEGFETDTLIDIKKKEIKIIENYSRKYFTEYNLVVPEEGFVEGIPMLTRREADEWETVPQIQVIRRNRSFIQKRVLAGKVLVDEDVMDDFDIIPVYAKKSGNFFYGKVEEVKDPQREINKRHSQAIDILNKQANYNWVIDGQTFKDARQERDFKANVATPGYVIEVNDKERNMPEKFEGSKIPAEVVALMDLSANKLREIMNIPAEALGFSEREFSGIALQEKKNSTLVANQFLFDNLNNAKRILAKRVMMKVAEVYDVERIVRLVNNSQPLSQNDQMKNIVNEQTATAMLENEDLMKYDVVTTPSAESPTARTANFAILFELAKQGIIQDPSILIQASDIPNKAEILGGLEAQAAAAQQAEQQKNQTEVFKSLPDELQAQALQSGQPLPGGPQA